MSPQTSIILMPPRADGRAAELRSQRLRAGPAFDLEPVESKGSVHAIKAVNSDGKGGPHTREAGREIKRADIIGGPMRRDDASTAVSNAVSNALVTDGKDTFFDRRRLPTPGFMAQHIAQELLPEKDGPERFRTTAVAYLTARDSTVMIGGADTHLDIQI